MEALQLLLISLFACQPNAAARHPCPPASLPATPCLQGKMIKAAKAEALIPKVMHSTPPGLFQHMMRTINSQVGKHLRSPGAACPGRPVQHDLASWPGWLLQGGRLLRCLPLPADMLPGPLPAAAGAGAAGHQAQWLRRPGAAHHVPAGAVVSTRLCL